MKMLSKTILCFFAGALMLLGVNSLSVASTSSPSMAGGQVISGSQGQRIAYTSRCHRVEYCVKRNWYNKCIYWKFRTVCPKRQL